jgi:hypothetical protein
MEHNDYDLHGLQDRKGGHGRSIRAQNTEAVTASELVKKIGKGLTAAFIKDNFDTPEWHHTNRKLSDGKPVGFYDSIFFGRAFLLFKANDLQAFLEHNQDGFHNDRKGFIDNSFDIETLDDVQKLFDRWTKYIAGSKELKKQKPKGVATITKKDYTKEKGSFRLTDTNIYEGIVTNKTTTQTTILAERQNGIVLKTKIEITAIDNNCVLYPDIKTVDELDKYKIKKEKEEKKRYAAAQKIYQAGLKQQQKERQKQLLKLPPFKKKDGKKGEYWNGQKMWAAVKNDKIVKAIYMNNYSSEIMDFTEHRENSKSELAQLGQVLSGIVVDGQFLPTK